MNVDFKSKRNNLDLQVFLAGAFNVGFEFFRGVGGYPFFPAQIANFGWNISNHNNPFPCLNGESGLSRFFGSPAKGADFSGCFCRHGFFLTRKPGSKWSKSGS
jgi:hypothetical protein